MYFRGVFLSQKEFATELHDAMHSDPLHGGSSARSPGRSAVPSDLALSNPPSSPVSTTSSSTAGGPVVPIKATVAELGSGQMAADVALQGEAAMLAVQDDVPEVVMHERALMMTSAPVGRSMVTVDSAVSPAGMLMREEDEVAPGDQEDGSHRHHPRTRPVTRRLVRTSSDSGGERLRRTSVPTRTSAERESDPHPDRWDYIMEYPWGSTSASASRSGSGSGGAAGDGEDSSLEESPSTRATRSPKQAQRDNIIRRLRSVGLRVRRVSMGDTVFLCLKASQALMESIAQIMPLKVKTKV